jgi:hypothetical protein
MLGEKIYSKPESRTKTNVNISSQAAGIYFLKIVDQDGHSVIKKLIKE